MDNELVKLADTGATLAGGIEVKDVVLEGGKVIDVFARQLPCSEWPAARRAVKDEFAFVCLVCRQAPGWTKLVAPESYERVQQACREANHLFFAWRSRQTELEWSDLPVEVRNGVKESLLVSLSPGTPRHVG